ncbi:hypothetical protein [Nitrobacter sp.]|uniref:hypothetical protein n=1 Tax=Nitrobacter sp. TaxID=29420 RepID=UPI0029CABF19|nr:hypothetical protein [Nitrobacter sp.]
MVAARPDDMLDDLFPGTGAVAEAWRTWRLKFALPVDPATIPPQPDSMAVVSIDSLSSLLPDGGED